MSFRPERSGVEKSPANWLLVTGYWILVIWLLLFGFCYLKFICYLFFDIWNFLFLTADF